MKMYFVTSNQNKLAEARGIIGGDIDRIDLDIPEIQAIDVSEVVEDKARKAYEQVHQPVLVEDTGLYINAWNGFPGALIRWVLKSVGNDGICKLLQNYQDRSAYAKTSVCFYDGSQFRTFDGRIEGIITDSPRGNQGFGWDPIFQPRGYNSTFAEMSEEEKNGISMRKEAFLKLKAYFDGV